MGVGTWRHLEYGNLQSSHAIGNQFNLCAISSQTITGRAISLRVLLVLFCDYNHRLSAIPYTIAWWPCNHAASVFWVHEDIPTVHEYCFDECGVDLGRGLLGVYLIPTSKQFLLTSKQIVIYCRKQLTITLLLFHRKKLLQICDRKNVWWVAYNYYSEPWYTNLNLQRDRKPTQ